MRIIGRWEDDAENKPLSSAILMLLVALLFIFFPTNRLGDLIGGRLIALTLVRLLASVFGIVFMLMFSFKNSLHFKSDILKTADIIILAFAVAVCNFPFFALADGSARLTGGSGLIAWHIIFCLSVGLFEELFFRGLIFSLLISYFKKYRLSELYAIAVSSIIFGLIHFVNLTAGAGIGQVLMQTGYSALIGAMCAVVYLFCKNIFIPAIIHAVFNMGGLLLENGIIEGMIWNPPAIILLSAVSAITGIYFVFKFFCRRSLSLS